GLSAPHRDDHRVAQLAANHARVERLPDGVEVSLVEPLEAPQEEIDVLLGNQGEYLRTGRLPQWSTRAPFPGSSTRSSSTWPACSSWSPRSSSTTTAGPPRCRSSRACC